MSASYQERNGHFATATLSARTMSVKYEDFVDFDDEVYILQDGFMPLVLASHSRIQRGLVASASTTP